MAASVKVRLELDGTPEAIAAVKAFAAQSKAAGKEASTGFAGMSNALSGVTKLFAAYKVSQAVVAIGQFTLASVRAAAEQKDLALSMGTTIGHFSALAAVAKATNTEQAKLISGLGVLGDRIKDLRNGAPDAARAFRQLGLGAKDFASNDIIVNAAKVGEALEKVGRGGTRGALAADALGKSGRALLPVFEKLNQLGGLEGATAFAKQLGFYVDASTIASFDQIAATLQEMELYARGIALQFAKAFGPEVLIALRNLQTVLVDGASGAEIMGLAVGNLARGFSELVVHTIAWGTVLGDIFTGKWSKAAEDFERFDKVLKDMRSAKPEAPAAVSDAVGAPTIDAEGAALLAAKQKYFDADQALYEANREREEAIDRDAYARGQLSLKQYFANRRQRIEEDAKYRNDRIEREIVETAKIQNEAQRDFERGALRDRQAAVDQDRQRRIADLEAEQRALSLAATIRGNLKGALTEFLSNGISQVRSLTQAFVQLGLAIASAFEQAIAAKFVTSLPFLGPGKAAGGPIYGPGTGTSDSVPIWASTGEYIVRAARVAEPGMPQLLHAANTGGVSRLVALVRQNFAYGTRRSHYADGGVVQGQLASAGSATVDGRIEVALSEDLVVRAIKSPEGQRALLHVVGRNRRAFGQALG